MRNYLNKQVLVTCQSWFYGKDGVQYRAIWGTLKAVHEVKEIFGFTPNRAHANWAVEIGDMVVMGCQVLYVIDCPIKPDYKTVPHVMYDHSNGLKLFNRPNEIYISE